MDIGNPESWAKLVDLVLSRKTAVKLLGAVVLFLAIALAGGVEALSGALRDDVPSGIIAGVIGVGCLALSVLLTDGAYSAGMRIARGRQGRLAAEARLREGQEADEKVRLRVSHTLPELAPDVQRFLSEFGGGAKRLAKDSLTRGLEVRGFLQKQDDIDRYSALYRLHPAARPIIEEYFAAARHRAITSNLVKIGTAERAFLQLFLQPSTDDRSKPDHPLLPAVVYAGAELLVRSQILVRAPAGRGQRYGEKIQVAEDAIPFVEELLGAPLKRTEVEIDFAQVASSVDSGSGTRGSQY